MLWRPSLYHHQPALTGKELKLTATQSQSHLRHQCDVTSLFLLAGAEDQGSFLHAWTWWKMCLPIW